MSNLLICLTLVLFSSCSYSMNVIQTQGEATDILDDTDSIEARANVKADVPVSFTTT